MSDDDRTPGNLLAGRELIIASNRGPISFVQGDDGRVKQQRNSGGLVTALLGLVNEVEATWISSGLSEAERSFGKGTINVDGHGLQVEFIASNPEEYNGYYNVIANPLLWFLQHSMWDFVRSPNITSETWEAWNDGYVLINRQFADTILETMKSSKGRPLVMLQDYHLYLAPRFIRDKMHPAGTYTLAHFIHIPWPGAEEWGFLPPIMRQAILEGLCSVDLLGFQTRQDGMNFIRTVESHLPKAHINYKRGRIWYRNHATHIRDFPISIDVRSLRDLADGEEVEVHRQWFEMRFGQRQMVVRIDRTEPSKNLSRGFQAFEDLLRMYPEHIGKVQFLALFVPSRLKVGEYQTYLDEVMAAAGRVNATFGTSDWEPVRVLLGEDYPRAIAAMQVYDVLLVNSITDGMNLVAKEGPIVNRRDGVVILSEQAGAREQLESGAMVISPCDIYGTAEALHQALVMPCDQRQEQASILRHLVETDDINKWLYRQLQVITELGL